MRPIDLPIAWNAMTAETLPHPAAAARPSRSGPVERLDQARQGCVYTVRRVDADPRVPERSRQLEEIGFFPGERVTVMTRGFPGGDPLVVRVGVSTFALRGAEAACVHVEAAATAQ
jgi:ferrous iron transport protein A